MPGEIRLDYLAYAGVGEVATSARRWWSAEWTEVTGLSAFCIHSHDYVRISSDHIKYCFVKLYITKYHVYLRLKIK